MEIHLLLSSPWAVPCHTPACLLFADTTIAAGDYLKRSKPRGLWKYICSSLAKENTLIFSNIGQSYMSIKL